MRDEKRICPFAATMIKKKIYTQNNAFYIIELFMSVSRAKEIVLLSSMTRMAHIWLYHMSNNALCVFTAYYKEFSVYD